MGDRSVAPASPGSSAGAAPPAEGAREWSLHRPLWSLLGARCRVYDASGRLVLFARRRPLRLRESIAVFEDEAETRAALRIRTESILDWGATYRVEDVRVGEPVGAVRRRALRSLWRDHWELLDSYGQVVGEAQEESAVLALLRRLGASFLPQRIDIAAGGRPVAELRQSWNPIVFRARLRLRPEAEGVLDLRLLLGLAVLLMVVEGRQEG